MECVAVLAWHVSIARQGNKALAVPALTTVPETMHAGYKGTPPTYLRSPALKV
jgi:hypothetical protein